MTGAVPARPALRRALLPLVCLLVVGLAVWWAQRLTHDAAHWPGLALVQAQALALPRGHALPEQPPAADDPRWAPVSLPDNWKQTRPDGAAAVWYRIALQPQGLASPAVLIPRLATQGQVFLNGTRLWDGRGTRPDLTRTWNEPLLLLLPAALLHEQGNELQVQVAGPPRYRAGLSQVQLGSWAELQPAARLRTRWQHDGALVSAALSTLAGLLTLLAWARSRASRGNRPLLFFAGATLFWGLRNSNLFLDELPIAIDTWGALVHLGHTGFNTLFGLFVLRFTRQHWPRFELLLWLYGAANVLLLGAGMIVSVEQALRFTALPAVALHVLLLALLLRHGWREATLEAALIAATALTFFVLSLRDTALLANQLPYEAYYLSHYTGLLMLVAMTWGLVSRLGLALQQSTELAATLEKRVDERTRQLQEANEAKSRFLAAASHDLRQPVVTLGLVSGLLRDSLQPGPTATAVPPDPAAPGALRLAGQLHDAAVSLDRLVHGLLDVSRLDLGAAVLRQPVALDALFQVELGLEGEAARARGIGLRVHPGAPVVHSDPVLLAQILRNLVSNALRATVRGGVLLAARRRADGSVWLQVWDSGRGIAPEEQQRIFEEFVRLGPDAQGPGLGLGLGLAIVRRAAAALGASLQLTSVPGRGSRFTLVIPPPGRAGG
ncbi:signal transduction histidine kinase [Burkholderiales bacterium JOSHI_001]|nr:signal transduction histidine kinase [Burkholderiales bacterium JOSHI_001]